MATKIVAHEISSRQNPHSKQILKLRDRRDRDRSGLFLIEGFREASRAITHDVKIEKFFFSKELFLGTHETELLHQVLQQGVPLFQMSAPLFRAISYRDRPDGLLAIAHKMNRSLNEISLPQNALMIIAESIEKPGNLGTIIRSADAAGADLVIVANRCTDIYNPNVVRASVGTLFTLPIIETSNEEAYNFCIQHKISLCAATPEAKMRYTNANMTQGIGIVVGTEQLGLSSFWKEQCQSHVSIPMAGIADSLNVATATTLLLFEAVRQRHAHSL